jgi:hypothetical protein
MRIYPQLQKRYQDNYNITFHPSFVRYMVDNIPPNCQFRIHVSGDFFHADYVRKWIEICRARPDVTFYAYTRSWRIPAIWDKIQELHALPNVNVNLSVDNETGPPNQRVYKNFHAASQMRWCYLTKTDSVPEWINEDDIVFRSNHNGQPGNHKWKRKKAIKQGLDPNEVAPLVKRLGGQVCPLEQGQDVPNFSCAKCRLCVDKPKVVAFV